MRRDRRPSLRGSVTQSTNTVRVRARESSRFGFAAKAAIIGGTLIVALGLGLWGWRSGWMHRMGDEAADTVLQLTQKAHFAIGDIVVEGRQHTNKDQLFIAIDATAGSPIFSFSPRLAEARITKLSWVESVSVQRRLPDTLYIHLSERVPMARWQHDDKIVVIDTSGKILADANAEQFGQLPLVVGSGAPAETKELLDTLHTFPMVEQKTAAAVRVGERRWDLHLQPKIVARLPESDLAGGLKRLSILISEEKILERDIVAIDLRMPDRFVIEPASQHPANGENRL